MSDITEARKMKRMKPILQVIVVTLEISATIDAYLWFAVGYMVPSWTIAAMSVGCALLIEIMLKILK